jgi:hypothetical protein
MPNNEKHTDIQFPLAGIDTSDAFDRQQPKSSPIGVNKTTPRAVNVRSFEAPLFTTGGQAPTSDQQGSVRYTEPLKQDVYARDVGTPGLLDAFKSNPYTQSLHST